MQFEEYDAIYRRAAECLAILQQPSFPGFPENEVFDAFNPVLRPSNYREWYPYFQNLLSEISHGQVSLEEYSFMTGIKGLNQTFLLKKGEEQKKVILATGVPPFVILE